MALSSDLSFSLSSLSCCSEEELEEEEEEEESRLSCEFSDISASTFFLKTLQKKCVYYYYFAQFFMSTNLASLTDRPSLETRLPRNKQTNKPCFPLGHLQLQGRFGASLSARRRGATSALAHLADLKYIS